jgi:CubicO group peptidase (beta-lactamase class C family)
VPDADPAHGELRMWRSADRLRPALEPPVVVAPGEIWNYSGGCTEILGALLPKCTGKPIDEFAQEACSSRLASQTSNGRGTIMIVRRPPAGCACAHATLQR